MGALQEAWAQYPHHSQAHGTRPASGIRAPKQPGQSPALQDWGGRQTDFVRGPPLKGSESVTFLSWNRLAASPGVPSIDAHPQEGAPCPTHPVLGLSLDQE